MGIYVKTAWVDRAIQYPLTYTQAAGVVGGTITFTQAPGIVTQAGTPQNAANFNHLEAQVLRNSKVASSGRVYAYKNLAGGM